MNTKTAMLLSMARTAMVLIQDGAENAVSFETGISDVMLFEQIVLSAIEDDPLSIHADAWRGVAVQARLYRAALRAANNGAGDADAEYDALLEATDNAFELQERFIHEALNAE